MELNNAKALLAKIAADPEMAKVFAAITDANAFAEAAKKYGYNVTLDEFIAARKEAVDSADGQKMGLDELAQTSGGLSRIPPRKHCFLKVISKGCANHGSSADQRTQIRSRISARKQSGRKHIDAARLEAGLFGANASGLRGQHTARAG